MFAYITKASLLPQHHNHSPAPATVTATPHSKLPPTSSSSSSSPSSSSSSSSSSSITPVPPPIDNWLTRHALVISLAAIAIGSGITAFYSLRNADIARRQDIVRRRVVRLIAKSFKSSEDRILNHLTHFDFNKFNMSQLKQVYKTFSHYLSDPEHGYLSRSKFEEILREFGVSDRSVRAHLFSFWDQNEDEYVDFFEIVTTLNLVCFGDKESHLKQYFNIFDLNYDGSITRGEFRQVIRAFGSHDEEQIDKIFKQVDADKNGKITLNEFLAISTMPEVDFTFNELVLKVFGLSKSIMKDI